MKEHATDRVREPGECFQQTAVGGVPEPEDAVVAPGRHQHAVPGEGNIAHVVGMRPQSHSLCAGCQVPENRRPVLAAGRERLAIRGKGDAVDIARMAS